VKTEAGGAGSGVQLAGFYISDFEIPRFTVRVIYFMK
jgi:hypothetical protein